MIKGDGSDVALATATINNEVADIGAAYAVPVWVPPGWSGAHVQPLHDVVRVDPRAYDHRLQQVFYTGTVFNGLAMTCQSCHMTNYKRA